MLYTGPLIQFLKEDIPYIPHVTVGRKESAELAAEVAKEIHSFPQKLQCVIDRISVERIGENGESIIEFEVPLQKADKSQLLYSQHEVKHQSHRYYHHLVKNRYFILIFCVATNNILKMYVIT